MKTLLLALLILAAGTPLRAAGVVAEPFPPARFDSLYIERDDPGTTTTLQTNGDAVIYRVAQGGKVVENLIVHPDGDAWFRFIQALNEAKVYEWAPSYEYPGQGASWIIDFTMDDRKFTSAGMNEYPKNGDVTQPAADPKAGPSIPFQLFWQAVLGLVRKTTQK